MKSDKEPRNRHLIMNLIEDLVNNKHDMVGKKIRKENTKILQKYKN